jgi:SAM-dependent methyltransferase
MISSHCHLFEHAKMKFMHSLSRKDMILAAIDVTKGPGIELGPLTSPIVTKEEADIYYIDHATLDELKKKYANEPVALDEIAPIDFALGNKTISEVVGKKKFDYVLASHVIEHVPNIVAWFQDIASVLKPGGILSLVIPDKRYIFDISRNVSRPADILGAYVENRTKPSARDMYDFATEYRRDINPLAVWDSPLSDHTNAPKRYTPQEALKMCKANLDPNTYVDCHCHVFTPEAFFAILHSLAEHDLLDFEIANQFEPNAGNIEFYVSLRKIDKKRVKKEKILKSIPRTAHHSNVETLRAQLEDERHKNQVLTQRVDELMSSTSWKATKPLRKGGEIARKVKQFRQAS